ncbi:MAG: hypothetical protein WCJ95_09475 [Mariniphaga sp.]
MITDAIQSILEPHVNSYSPIVESDIFPEGVFVIHQEDIIETLRDKSEIYAMIYNVAVIIIGDSQEDIDPVIDTVITEILTCEGEILGTIIEDIELKGTQGTTWDDEKKKYYDKITFTVQTKNR